MIAHRAGDLDKAEKDYRKVLELVPYHPGAMNNLAWILCEDRKKPDAALDIAMQGVSRYPTDPHLLNTRGVIFFRLGMLQQARKDFEQCVGFSDNEPATQARTLLCLGRVLMREGQSGPARARLNEALAIDHQRKILTAAEHAEAERLVRASSQ
jgi:Flp pilus assembly protein TadD